jgi:transposase
MEKKTPETPPDAAVVAIGTQRPRRRYSAEEKARLLAEAEAPGSSVSIVARKYGLSGSLLFRWRHHRDAGSLTGLKAGEPVVPESEVQKLKAQVRELQRLLGRKTEEVEALRMGIEIAREKKLLSPAVLSKLEELL